MNNEMLFENDSDNSFDTDVESVYFNSNHFLIKRIKHNRNRPRINNGNNIGALSFYIIWEDNTETTEPIQNLIDKDNESVNEHILDIINDYKNTAREYPRNNRCCIMCFNKINNGMFMCYRHTKMYSFLNS